MKMAAPQFEVLRIPEPLSLPFESLDFVDQALYGAACDAMIEVLESVRTEAARGEIVGAFWLRELCGKEIGAQSIEGLSAFYDEPTSRLDLVVTGVIGQLILDLSKRMGITSIMPLEWPCRQFREILPFYNIIPIVGFDHQTLPSQ